ncbi:hypothetical protein [Streptomyces sp. NPDC001741]|uniref:hypothetical protein n=1 Tax=unclassified Streptomyces TaxID=2593676 RepID=UPI00369839A6
MEQARCPWGDGHSGRGAPLQHRAGPLPDENTGEDGHAGTAPECCGAAQDRSGARADVAFVRTHAVRRDHPPIPEPGHRRSHTASPRRTIERGRPRSAVSVLVGNWLRDTRCCTSLDAFVTRVEYLAQSERALSGCARRVPAPRLRRPPCTHLRTSTDPFPRGPADAAVCWP